MHRSVALLQAKLLHKSINIADVVDAYLERIKDNEHHNAFISVFDTDAQDYIERINQKITKDPTSLGKLFGCVISIKDNICYANHPVQAGSKILDSYVSPYSATAVERLIAEDAFIIGSTNCDEFGMGSTSENPHFGPVRNGINDQLIAGGSSGGSAVSVQLDLCMAALGSDTGGSVRQPAAMCGVYGFKPSYGHISRHGLIAYASSFDQIGILAHDIYLVQLIYEVISGEDAYDATCQISEPINQIEGKPTFAVIKGAFDSKDDIVRDAQTYIDALSTLYQVSDVDFSYLDSLVSTYYILTTAEASSNLNRYDGVRYGLRSKDSNNLQDLYFNSRTEGFGPEVKKRIMLGAFVLSEGYFDAYYTQAQKVRRLIRDEIDRILESFDFILLPTITSQPWSIGTNPSDPLAVYQSDIFTVLANICGIPAVTIPLRGQPFRSQYGNIQVLTKRKKDNALLNWLSLA